MQVKNPSFQGTRYQTGQTDYSSRQFDFLNEQRSPSSINKHFSSPKLDNADFMTNMGYDRTLDLNGSLGKLRTDQFSKLSLGERYSVDLNVAQGKNSNQAFKSIKTVLISDTLDPENTMNTSKTVGVQKGNLNPRNNYSSDFGIEPRLAAIQNQSLKSDNQKANQTIKKLRLELQQKALMLQKFNQLMKVKYSELKQVRSELSVKQIRIEQLEKQSQNNVSSQQSVKLKKALFLKGQELDILTEKINNLEHQNFRNEVYQIKISKLNDQLIEEKNKNSEFLVENSRLNQRIKQLEESYATLEYRQQKSSVLKNIADFENIERHFKDYEASPTKSGNKQAAHLAAFDQALKVQMKQVEELKQVIQTSQELTQKLRDDLVSARRQLQDLRNQVKIIDLKSNSERKKLIMEYRLQIHEKDNEINSAFKKYKTLQEKYKNAFLDIKAKDDFFKQHLVGRVVQLSIQEYIEDTLSKYTQKFQDIMALKSENSYLLKKLQRYQQYQAWI